MGRARLPMNFLPSGKEMVLDQGWQYNGRSQAYSRSTNREWRSRCLLSCDVFRARAKSSLFIRAVPGWHVHKGDVKRSYDLSTAEFSIDGGWPRTRRLRMAETRWSF